MSCGLGAVVLVFMLVKHNVSDSVIETDFRKNDIEQLQDVTAVFMLIDKVTARKCERCFAIRLQLWWLGKSPVERISLLDKFNC